MGTAAGTSYALEVAVYAGPAPCDNCPVTAPIPDGVELPAGVELNNVMLVRGTEAIPAAVLPTLKCRELAFIVDGMKPFEKRVYQLVTGSVVTENAVTIQKTDGALDVQIGGKPFTTYTYEGDDVVRPAFLSPLWSQRRRHDTWIPDGIS